MNRILRRIPRPRALGSLVVGLAVLGGLYLTSGHYLLFHSLVEMFSVVVAFGIFTVFWNARRFLDNGCFLFLGVAYLFVGGLDLLHTLAYKGMGVFSDHTANLATQLWVAARFVESFSILAAPLFLRRRLNPYALLIGYAAVVSLLLGSIFGWKVFPTCYAGRITPFKVASEYVICLVLLVSLALLHRRRGELDARVYRLLSISIVLTIAAELVFTSYTRVTDTRNMIGHFLKLISFYPIYVALVEVGLTNPHAVLFRRLKESEEQLQAVNETLERRVTERTRLAEQRAEQLRALASELTVTEQRERRRLAQVLHDHLQQFLVAAKLKAAMLRRRVEDAKKRETLGQLDELLDQAIDASRSLTVELSPPLLHDAGLAAALEWLARQMRKQHGLCVEVVADAEAEPRTDELRFLIFQAVRELLFNVVKHARAGAARVEMSRAADRGIRVTVSDAGVGFDAPELERAGRSGGGFGLFSIGERLRLSGGRLEIDAAPGRGTRVSIFAPLARPARAVEGVRRDGRA
jgi:signal transduction histidine kinase